MRDEVRINHILSAVTDLEICMKGVADYHEFMADIKLKYAAVRLIEIIGEAANHISEEVKSKHPEVDWPAIRGMRNILIHEYFGISYQDVWDAIHVDIPLLKEHLTIILKEIRE